ncbi:hypothetical protein BDZ97DRAFT_1911551 [Flammula alnicola]|nr:hypothetical protein BDZ97DRAFT_1911551 [Flammula alnicola]
MFYENTDTQLQLSSQPSNRVNVYFEQLRGEILTILDNETGSRDTIRRLETELGFINEQADKQKEDLENQLKGHRIVTLLDGDGAIFHNNLIVQGQPGGHIAAQRLSDSIIQHLTSTNGANQISAAKVKFDEFIMGFNQAAERFIMLDVGSAKEAADAKIKGKHCWKTNQTSTDREDNFGGCHDNGYTTTLRSQITAGFKHKLILLRGYTDMAAGINELELPSFSIPDLFIPQKLVIAPTLTPSSPPLASLPKAVLSQPASAPAPEAPAVFKSPPSIIQQGFEALPFASVEPEVPVPKSPPSYSSAVQTPALKRVITPELDSSGSTSSSDGSDDNDSLPNLRPSLTNSKSRRVNPNIPLSKHKPPPCTLFYLSSSEHFNEIRVNAKKSPCPSRNKGEYAFGEKIAATAIIAL